MIVIPAVDILGGMAVQLVGGKPGTEKISLPNPWEVAQDWVSKGAQRLHLVDLDAAMGSGDNLQAIAKIVEAVDVPIEVGGGIRTTEKAETLLDLGVDIIAGTRAVSDPEWLKDLAQRYPDKVILALDVKQGKIQLKGWKESSSKTLAAVLEEVANLPLKGVLHTNVDVEGQNKGINVNETKKFRALCPHPIIESGGISSKKDLALLEEIGIEYAVVGMAIYTGAIKPEEVWRQE